MITAKYLKMNIIIPYLTRRSGLMVGINNNFRDCLGGGVYPVPDAGLHRNDTKVQKKLGFLFPDFLIAINLIIN